MIPRPRIALDLGFSTFGTSHAAFFVARLNFRRKIDLRSSFGISSSWCSGGSTTDAERNIWLLHFEKYPRARVRVIG